MFVPVAAQTVGDLAREGQLPSDPTVVELGNQSYSVDQKTIQALLTDFPKLKSLVGRRPAQRPKDPLAPHVSEFFHALGFKSYESIDINNDLGSLAMDLNLNLKEKYGFTKQYDLVTNIGVSEHLFGQEAFMRNMHEVTKEGGLMLHVLPFLGYINHGFWNYEPRIFYDLAASNGYDLLQLKLTERDRVLSDLLVQTETLTYFHQYLPLLVKNEEHNAFVVAVLRKNKNSEFAIPLQGKYLEDIGEDSIKDVYGSQAAILNYPPPKGFFTQPPMSLRVRIKAAILRRLWGLLRQVLTY